MRKDLMEILACPDCKGQLELNVKEEKDDEVITGDLYCKNCDFHFPIEDSIPNLLPKELQTQQSSA